MAEAVARIWQAKDQNEHILIYGDYDVMGFVQRLVNADAPPAGMYVDAFIPELIGDGYGNRTCLRTGLRMHKATLIITVDGNEFGGCIEPGKTKGR